MASQSTGQTLNKFHIVSLYVGFGIGLLLTLSEAARICVYEYHDLVTLGRELGVW